MCFQEAYIIRSNQELVGLFFRAGRLGDTGDLELTSDPARLEECSAVLMGEGPYDWRTTWEALIDFFRHHPERPFIVPNPDTCWPNASTGGIGIGAGGQARCIRLLLHPRALPPICAYLSLFCLPGA